MLAEEEIINGFSHSSEDSFPEIRRNNLLSSNGAFKSNKRLDSDLLFAVEIDLARRTGDAVVCGVLL